MQAPYIMPPPPMNTDLYQTKRIRDKWAKWVKIASVLMLILATVHLVVGTCHFVNKFENSHHIPYKFVFKRVIDFALICASIFGIKASKKKDSKSAKRYLRVLGVVFVLLLVGAVVCAFVMGAGNKHHNKNRHDHKNRPKINEDDNNFTVGEDSFCGTNSKPKGDIEIAQTEELNISESELNLINPEELEE